MQENKTVTSSGKKYTLVALIVVQSLCAAFFLFDVVVDGLLSHNNSQTGLHLAFEIAATVVLILGIVVEIQYLTALLRINAQFEQSLQVASGALSSVIDQYFSNWKLTGAESDVALFAIKGFSNNEIAKLRGSGEGTIKAHLNSVYRKADVTSRGQLVSLLIDDLLNAPNIDSLVEKSG